MNTKRSVIVSFYAISAVGGGAGTAVLTLVWLLLADSVSRSDALYAVGAIALGAALILGGVGLWRRSAWTYIAFSAWFTIGMALGIADGVLEAKSPLEITALVVGTALAGALFVKLVYAYTRTQA